MRHNQQLVFENTLETVIEMLTDPAYYEKKYSTLGLANFEIIEHELKDDQFLIRVQYNAESDVPLPDFAKRLVAGELQVEQLETWNVKQGTGKIEVILKGLPFNISADRKLNVQDKNTTVNDQNWDIRCSIPMVGVKLEKLMLADVLTKAEAEVNVSNRLLLDY